MSKVPVIETERLRLRRHELVDFQRSWEMWSDAMVTRFIGGKPSTESQCWARLMNYVGQWELLGFGYWAIEDRATGHFIGEIGLGDFRRAIAPKLHGIPEVGWALRTDAQGRGFGSEALAAVLAWSDARPNLRRTVCLIDPRNEASLRMAARAGFQEFARTNDLGDATIIFERRPSDRENIEGGDRD